jgi:acyl-CoA thioesterase-1
LFFLFGCHSSQPAPATASSAASASANDAALAADDTDNSAPRPQLSADPNDHRPVLVCFGDSLTAGHGTDPGHAYPDFLQSDLDQRGYHYRVVNLGISGNTTKDGVARLPEVLSLHPSLAVVEFGGNDGLRGLRIDDSRANLDHIVSALQHAGIKVALAGITLPPDYGPDYIRQFNETYTVLAKKYRVPLLPFLLNHVYGQPGMMQRDQTHATAKGNEVVAQNVLALVTPLLKK